MYARSTTIHADPASIDAGIAHVRDDVMPALQAIEGNIGLSMLVDRQSGLCIATSAWQSEESMLASEGAVRSLRDRAAEVLRGSTQVEMWEIAVLHRDHASREASGVRATWLRVAPDRVDRAIDMYKMASLPAMEELEGFCSASLLVDRSAGRSVSSVTYDSIDVMVRNREHASALRDAASQEAGAEVLDVLEFELALAHLHVPEMA